MDQQRLATLWRAGVAANAVAVAATAMAWAAPGLIGWWALAIGGVLLLAGTGVSWRTRPQPFHGAEWRAYSDPDRRAAAKRLLRGAPVDPPALRTEGLDVARRSLWSIGAQGLLAPAMTSSFVTQRNGPDTGLVLAVLGTLWLAGGLAAVIYLGSRRRRLDALESATPRRTSPVGEATS